MKRKKPLILISSSGDLKGARAKLGANLRSQMRDMSLQINPYLWEDETEDGRTIQPGTPIQKQINAMLGERVQLAIVMFGERIGEPLSGDPVEGTRKLLKRWAALGLRHPWPEDTARRAEALEQGHFPLTGTVYELLIALSLNRDDGSNGLQLGLKLGYVANRDIVATLSRDDITLNEGRWSASADKPAVGSRAHSEWVAGTYNYQKQAVLNLMMALARSPHGTFPRRFETEEAMVQDLTRQAVRDLQRMYPAELFEAVFKPDLSPFAVDDPMPFPDREDLREILGNRLLTDCAKGEVLALHGSSGCGKSSLLQKGLLGADPAPVRDAVPVALRPSDIAARPQATPLLRFLCTLADCIETTIGAVPGLRDPAGGRLSDKIDNAIAALEAALARNRVNLILGIDQVEEILDQASLDSDQQRGQPRSWWHILHFIGRAAHKERIWVAVTLESQRLGRWDEMAVEDRTGLRLSLVNVNFEVSKVTDFVLHVANHRGLPLSRRLANSIERMVEDYESGRRSSAGAEPTSSFLPLLSLWLHRLFVKFRDRKRRSGGTAEAFGRSVDEIDLDDLKHHGIERKLDSLVPELVEDAWDEGRELSALRIIENASVLNSFINYIAQSSPAGRQLVARCAKQDPFDIALFVDVLEQNGIHEIPGTTKRGRAPSQTAVANFFSGLVGIDDDGNMRLTDMPRHNDTSTVAKLIESHLRRRLLEPVGTTNRVRLVHQAIVDKWEPARSWYEAERSRLLASRNVKQAAHAAGPYPDYAALAADDRLVSNAASMLAAKRAIWGGATVKALPPGELDTREFCLGLLSAAPNGRLEYGCGSDQTQPIAFEAARYDLLGPLTRWLNDDPDLARIENYMGNTLLAQAGWFASQVIALLLTCGVGAKKMDADGWHPIGGAIQSGNIGGLEILLGEYDGPEVAIGPGGATMLHVAASSPSSTSMERLLKQASDPDVPNASGVTPLLAAALADRAKIAGLLIQTGANILARTENGANVLNCAARSNSAEIVRMIRDHAGDDEREELLFGRPDDQGDWLTPISSAARFANPDAMRALLEWVGNDPITRHAEQVHPLLTVLDRDRRAVSQPFADRISACVELLLNHSQVAMPVLEAALKQTGHLPDAKRLIENHIVLHSDNLDAVDSDTVLACVLGERFAITAAALTKRPTILDSCDKQGVAASQRILAHASPETLLLCLAEGIEPSENPEMFRLEAALKVYSKTFADAGSRSDRPPGSDLLDLIFPLVPASRLHPVILALVKTPETERYRRLMAVGGGNSVRTLLHRLAVRGDLELYGEIVEGLDMRPPHDVYGRVPSAVAPPSMRREFEALEHANVSGAIH